LAESMKTNLVVDVEPIAVSSLRRVGLTSAVVAPLLHAPCVLVGAVVPEFAQLLAASPRLFEALQQAQAALPDPSFASKCRVPREVLEEIGRVLADSSSYDRSSTELAGANGLDRWQYDPKARVDPELLEHGFDAEVVGADAHGELYTIAATTKVYAPIMANARGTLRALEEAHRILPAAWIAEKKPVPADVMELMRAAIAQAKGEDTQVLEPSSPAL
jgi:hypothetical protein